MAGTTVNWAELLGDTTALDSTPTELLTAFVGAVRELSSAHGQMAVTGNDLVVAGFGAAADAAFEQYPQWYKGAEEFARLIAANQGYVMSGGGPGIMERLNRGAQTGRKGSSIGLVIKLPTEDKPNDFLDVCISFKHFFSRKEIFRAYADVFVGFPGGFGTKDEMFQQLTLMQCLHSSRVPFYLFGRDYWTPWVEQLDRDMDFKFLAPDHRDLVHKVVFDDPQELADEVLKQWRTTGRIRPNPVSLAAAQGIIS